jgi:hypothetical protein
VVEWPRLSSCGVEEQKSQRSRGAEGAEFAVVEEQWSQICFLGGGWSSTGGDHGWSLGGGVEGAVALLPQDARAPSRCGRARALTRFGEEGSWGVGALTGPCGCAWSTRVGAARPGVGARKVTDGRHQPARWRTGGERHGLECSIWREKHKC